MDKKEKEYIEDNISWSKGAQGGWCGAFILKDGYSFSVVANPSMKMREAKSLIREKIFSRVPEIALERNTTIM